MLRECSHADSKKYEIEYIKIFNSDKFGYNAKDLADAKRRRHRLVNQLILEYAEKNGYEPDGDVYWFNIFELSKELKITVIDILKHFGVNTLTEWNVSYKVNEDTYIGICWNGEDGVQVIVFHESFLNS